MNVGRLFQWTIIDKVGGGVILFACMALLARFVSPEDFGMVGALALFISLGNLLVDCGLGGFLVKKKDVTNVDYGTLFVYNGVCSVILYGVLWLIAPLVNWFFRNDGLGDVLKVLSLSIVLNAFSIVQYVKLLKNLEMKKISIVSITSCSLASVCAVVLAMRNWGVWACVSFFVLQAFFRSAGFYLAERSLSALCFDWKSFKQQFSFGGYLVGANILNVTSGHLTTFAIGRVFPISVLGYYYQAHRLYSTGNDLLTAVIDRVAFPVLCKADEKNMTQKSHSIFKPIFTLIYPAVAVSIVIVLDFIILFFGEQWRPVGLYCAILLLALFPGLIRIMLRNILKSSGETKMILIAEIATVIVTLILVGAALCFSVLFLVSSMVASMVFSMLFYAWISHAKKMITPGDIIRLIAIPACAAVLAASAGGAVLLLCGTLPALIRIVCAGIAGFSVALIFYICVRDEFCLYWIRWCKKRLKSGKHA